MGLVEMQRAMARLYTDTDLRERLVADPARVGEELGLDPAEMKQVASLSAKQVDFFAHSLQHKRLNEVCKLLPLSERVWGKSFAYAFRRFASAYLPEGIDRHRNDAIAFAGYLEEIARREKRNPPWLPDLLRYESARLKIGRPGQRWIAVPFRYPISGIAYALARALELPPVHRHPTLILWLRPGREVRQFILRAPRLMVGRK